MNHIYQKPTNPAADIAWKHNKIIDAPQMFMRACTCQRQRINYNTISLGAEE